jgi:hypothetical protein
MHFFHFYSCSSICFAYNFLGIFMKPFNGFEISMKFAENADNNDDYLKAQTYLFSFSLEAVPDLATARPVYLVLILEIS